MKTTIGVIGIGAMGRGMVGMLIQNGYPVTVYDVNKDAVDVGMKLGADAEASAQAVGQAAEIVITSLPSPQSFKEAVLGEKGVLEGLSSGAYIIDMSTIDPVTTLTVHTAAAARGIRTLDAPVSGGPQGAAAGTLAIMVGGDKADFEACTEIFHVLGKNIFHVGPIGAGQTVKVCNNALAAIHTVAMGEVLQTGMAAGVDLKTLCDVFRTSSGNCWTLENFFPKTVLQNTFDPPQFALDLMHKDVGLYVKTAEKMKIPSMLSAIAYQIYTAGQNAGKGQCDHTAVVQVMEALARGKSVQ